MRRTVVALLAAALALLSATPAGAGEPDPTVPYLPGYRTVCAAGPDSCFEELRMRLAKTEDSLGCGHDVMFVNAYLTITENLIAARSRGYFSRPDRLNHQAKQYAWEYYEQYRRWHLGQRSTVSPSWAVAFQAADEESVTGLGDLMLQLTGHILRDNPIRSVEQTESVLRGPGPMPESSGRPDHERIDDVLQSSLVQMMEELAARYDPTVDDGTDAFAQTFGAENLYELIRGWRELAWRNGEQLRHARASGGVNGPLYQAKLAQIEKTALEQALLIRAQTQTTPAQNAARNAYCAAHG